MAQTTKQSMTRSPRRKQQMDKTSKILLLALAVIGVLLAFMAGRAVFNLVKGWSLTALPGAPVDTGTAGGKNNTTGSELNITSSTGPEALAWDGKSRVNILLLGLDASDQRDLTEPGPRMSDTMILITIDPLSQTLGALSIRRDLWVNIPGYDYHKINKAHFLGEAYQLPGGGAGLAVKTVEEFLGVPIHFYAKVDFDTFVKVIDQIEGVKVNVTERILADWDGDGNNTWLEPGTYALPGTAALAYARYRGGDDGDIGRGARQMEIISAIRDRILDFNMLPNLISSAPAIYKDVSDGVQTNMSFDQAVQIMVLMTQIPREKFKTYNITYEMAEPTTVTTYDEGTQYILRPFPEKIRALRDQVFATDGVAAAPIVTGNEDPLRLAMAENGRISLYNGTATGGLAEDTQAYLLNQGLNVVEIGSASEGYTYTTIIVHNSKPYTLAYLAEIMNVPSTRIFNKYDPNKNTDIIVFLGSDWASDNPMP
jgi:LCP family protein required for cell wall assembly